MSESVVLCEGYHDRAFWAGWLLKLGCTDPSKDGTVFDSLGRPVQRGQFMFHSRGGRFIRVVPCHGKPNVRREARSRLEGRSLEPRLTRLVLNVDADVVADETSPATGLRVADVLAIAKQFDSAAHETHRRDVVMDNGAVVVSLVRWETADAGTTGYPAQQTLERVVCAALVAAYPDRGTAVQRWLDGRPDGPDAGPKEFAWSHMAGWYAEHACEAFFRCLWEDEAVAGELQSRLRSCGGWQIAEAISE